MSGIDCRQAETLVARYIKHTLSTDELEEFLDNQPDDAENEAFFLL